MNCYFLIFFFKFNCCFVLISFNTFFSHSSHFMIDSAPVQIPISTVAHASTPINTKQFSDATMQNYQHHIEDLQRKLRITTDMCADQELNYKNAFNDMELKFRRTLSQRDEFIKLR